VFNSDDPLEREAAALVCHASSFEPARKLLEQNPEIKSSIEKGRVSWEGIAERMLIGEW
jgi:hypothetical protein